MVEMVKNLVDIETLTSQMTARCHDAREQAAKEESHREHEARTRDRDSIRKREPGGEHKWHIQKQFKPAKLMDLDFMVLEVRAWNRQLDQYFLH